ncbi:MAG: glycosyltransferase [Candidatus Pacebacteria bacterium]|nr:glycosyltransferase [Candidatus Paceibacterota bacterium]
MKPKLVVVIPTKDRRALLERALESVRQQSYPDYRVVIVNDGSRDDTREYLDALEDSRIQVIHHVKARGVNAARNEAFRTLKENEWAVQLDDDDMLLPNTLETIARVIKETPGNIQVLSFNAITRTPKGDYASGYQFAEGQTYADPTYENFMLGLPNHGDGRMVLKWSLFPKYLFAEDVNGFEGEWWLLIAREGASIRYVPDQTTLIDQSHGQEHLSNVAARRNPASFVRSYRRIFRDHARFFATHPRQAMPSAMSGMKLSVRSFDIPSGLYFFWLYCRSVFQIALGTQRMKKQP